MAGVGWVSIGGGPAWMMDGGHFGWRNKRIGLFAGLHYMESLVDGREVGWISG